MFGARDTFWLGLTAGFYTIPIILTNCFTYIHKEFYLETPFETNKNTILYIYDNYTDTCQDRQFLRYTGNILTLRVLFGFTSIALIYYKIYALHLMCFFAYDEYGKKTLGWTSSIGGFLVCGLCIPVLSFFLYEPFILYLTSEPVDSIRLYYYTVTSIGTFIVLEELGYNTLFRLQMISN